MKYDIFISYSTENNEIAQIILKKLEQSGKRCFFAPRNIDGGTQYAAQIIKAIENSKICLLVLSNGSNRSDYVLREINAAVSRGKCIIPLKIEEVTLSETMEFYIGPIQIVDILLGFNEEHLSYILNKLKDDKADVVSSTNLSLPRTDLSELRGPIIKTVQELLDLNYTPEYISMRQIELDYLVVDQQRFDIIEQIEGCMSDWVGTVVECADCSAQLIINGQIMGYMDFYPVNAEYYDAMAKGAYFDKSKIECYQLGGVFDIFVSMFSVDYRYMTQRNFALFIQWIYKLLQSWKAEGITVNRIMFSLYNDSQVRMLNLLGFKNIYTDRVKGMLCATDYNTFMNSTYIRNNEEKWS